jgi:putative ABC transport system ATP-binding protein
VTPALVAEHLYRFYHAGDDETLALRGVSLTVDAGEIVAVTGPSGSGKSTLLMCLAGLDDPDGGTVYVEGERLSRRTEQQRAVIRARRIGVLYQSANLLDHLSVEGNLTLVQRLAGEGGAAERRQVLEEMDIAQRSHARPGQLSGGESARAGLAVALVAGPRVVLADEPTGELDSTTARRVLELLRRRADAGAAVIVVTHDDEVAAAADREIPLRDGMVVS